jgi:hypothetical protein
MKRDIKYFYFILLHFILCYSSSVLLFHNHVYILLFYLLLIYDGLEIFLQYYYDS